MSNKLVPALIMGLARIGSLRVTSRTTSLRYTGTALSVPEIKAKVLGANAARVYGIDLARARNEF